MERQENKSTKKRMKLKQSTEIILRTGILVIERGRSLCLKIYSNAPLGFIGTKRLKASQNSGINCMYSKASRYTASRCTDLDNARF